MKKNKKIMMGIILALILVAVLFIILKPKYELNKAVKYLKYGNYKEAYEYVQSKNNEENKVIIKELITEIFFYRAGNGIEKVGNIVSQCTNVVKNVNLDNIDYSLDDNINIEVKSLDTYIDLEKDITKDMIDEEAKESYDLYFSVIKYVHSNFEDVLNHIFDEEYRNKVSSLTSDMTKLANYCYSYSDNHKYNPKTQDIYKQISEYITK